jgi:RNA polymerase sigma factor (sigma-70 family)
MARPPTRATWVAAQIMPHERAIRMWLARSMVSPHDIDDLIQEAYCRLAGLDRVDHITRPDAYFFQSVRNLLMEQIRRSRVVRIETAAEIDLLVLDKQPTPEDQANACSELNQIERLMANLPTRCRRIFEMRKIDGLSQREIAEKMGISESVVENEGARGLRLILASLGRDAQIASDDLVPRLRERRKRKRP